MISTKQACRADAMKLQKRLRIKSSRSGRVRVWTTRHSLNITQTHRINVTHRITSFSHIYSHALSHTHTFFFPLTQTHKVTAFPLTRSVLKPQAPQIAIITSLPLCLLSGSLLHVVKLSHPAVTPTPKESTAPSSMQEPKIRKRPSLVCNYYPGTCWV